MSYLMNILILPKSFRIQRRAYKLPKILFVATVVKTHIMQFHIPYLEMFHQMGWETSVAARNDYENPEDCVIPYCDVFYNIPFERSPFHIKNIQAYQKIKTILDQNTYSIIHCHTPVGAALTRLAAKDSRKNGTKIFYTAHGFHFYKGAPFLNWLIYYPVEYMLASFTDVLITINQEDYRRAQHFKAKKVYYIPGVGIDTGKFCRSQQAIPEKRKELGFEPDDFIILSVGELIYRKNHQAVLKALSMLRHHPEFSRIHYILCGSGKLEFKLKRLSHSLKIADHVHFLGYQNDMAGIYQCCDLFVFMSFQEGLPVALMEAMGCGLPVICSKIRGNIDLVQNNVNGMLIENKIPQIAFGIKELLTNKEKRTAMGIAGQMRIQKLDQSKICRLMRNLYLKEVKREG